MNFTISPMDIASFDEERSSRIIEPGDYVVMLGSSSQIIMKKGSFTVPDEIVVEQVSNALAPNKELNRLHASK